MAEESEWASLGEAIQGCPRKSRWGMGACGHVRAREGPVEGFGLKQTIPQSVLSDFGLTGTPGQLF